MIKVAKLQEDRWADFKALRLESLKRNPTAFGSAYEEEALFKRDIWESRIHNAIFALSSDKPVGTITCLFNERKKTSHIADIVGFYVTPSFRSQGIGTKLLAEAVELAKRKKGVIKITLAVNPEQKSAINLYKSAGFVTVGKAKKQFKIGRNYFDMLYMEKFL